MPLQLGQSCVSDISVDVHVGRQILEQLQVMLRGSCSLRSQCPGFRVQAKDEDSNLPQLILLPRCELELSPEHPHFSVC